MARQRQRRFPLIFINTPSACQRQFVIARSFRKGLRRLPDADIDPNRLHRNRLFSWLTPMSIPRSRWKSSNVRSESGNRTHIVTNTRTLSGAVINLRNGLRFCHPAKLLDRPARLNRFCSDSAYKPSTDEQWRRQRRRPRYGRAERPGMNPQARCRCRRLFLASGRTFVDSGKRRWIPIPSKVFETAFRSLFRTDANRRRGTRSCSGFARRSTQSGKSTSRHSKIQHKNLICV